MINICLCIIKLLCHFIWFIYGFIIIEMNIVIPNVIGFIITFILSFFWKFCRLSRDMDLHFQKILTLLAQSTSPRTSFLRCLVPLLLIYLQGTLMRELPKTCSKTTLQFFSTVFYSINRCIPNSLVTIYMQYKTWDTNSLNPQEW